MVPNLQLHRGLAERGLLHGACQRAAGLQHREVVHGHKHKVVRHSTKPEPSIHEHQGTGFGDSWGGGFSPTWASCCCSSGHLRPAGTSLNPGGVD